MGGQKTVGKVISESIGYYKRNFKLFFITALFVYGFTYLLNMFISFIVNILGIDTSSIRQVLDGASSVFGPLLTLLGACLVLLLSSVIYRILSLLEEMLYINASYVMIQVSHGDRPRISNVALNFGHNWKRYLGISAWASLWTWLWYLVFFIPGLVKSYSYMLAPYLIIEYPEMTVRQALKKSKEITLGYKGRLFGLEFCLGLPYLIFIDIPNRLVDLQQTSYNNFANIIFSIVALIILEPIGYMMFTTAYLDIKQAAIEKGLLPPDTEPSAADQEGDMPVGLGSDVVDSSVQL